MKFTKFIPVAIALLLTVPAYAENAGSNSAESQMQITVPEYINITRTSHVNASTATPTADYASLTLSPQLNAVFRVVTNTPGDHVYLSAKAPVVGVEGATLNALCAGAGEDASKYYLVFTKADSTTAVASIQNITNGGNTVAPESNADAIAFLVTPTFDHSGAASADPAPAAITGAGVVAYSIDQGIYDMTYTIGTAPIATTFSTHDTNGTYQATITLSHTSP